MYVEKGTRYLSLPLASPLDFFPMTFVFLEVDSLRKTLRPKRYQRSFSLILARTHFDNAPGGTPVYIAFFVISMIE